MNWPARLDVKGGAEEVVVLNGLSARCVGEKYAMIGAQEMGGFALYACTRRSRERCVVSRDIVISYSTTVNETLAGQMYKMMLPETRKCDWR